MRSGGSEERQSQEILQAMATLDSDELDTLLLADKKHPAIGAPPGTKHGAKLSADERRQVLRLMALGWTNREILTWLNEERTRNGGDPLSPDFYLEWYRSRYRDVLARIQGRFAQNVGQVCRFADKLVRVRHLNELAEGIVAHMRRAEPGRHEWRQDVRLLLRVFAVIQQETGDTPLGESIPETACSSEEPTREDALQERLARVQDRLAQSIDFPNNTDEE